MEGGLPVGLGPSVFTVAFFQVHTLNTSFVTLAKLQITFF